jgi:hypothetical protein
MNKIFLLLIVSNFIFSQNEIKLPQIEKNNFNTLHIPFHSIALTNSNVILFDNDTIEIHELKYRLLSNYQNQPFDYTSTMGRLKNVHLFIDVEYPPEQLQFQITGEKILQFITRVVGNNVKHFYEPFFRIDVVEFAVCEKCVKHSCSLSGLM